MTEADFRIKHSKLIGHYQLIEMRLKGICAQLTTEKQEDWYNAFESRSTETFKYLIDEIKDIQKSNKTEWFSNEDFDSLNSLRIKRNYWVHNCFDDIVFTTDKSTKVSIVKRQEYGIKIIDDLREAIEWDEKLVDMIHKINTK